MTKLAQLIAREEGYGIPGAIPTVRNNPGDLRHSNHSQHPGGPGHEDDIGTIDTVEHGWEDLEHQLQIYACEGLTLREMVNVYLGVPADAPVSIHDVDGNNRVLYLRALCNGLGNVDPETKVSQLLSIQV